MSEHEQQAALIEFCQRFSGRVPELALLLAIPNGGKRSIGTAVKMKKEGVQPGVPDLFLPVPRADRHGLWIEMKTATGVLSKAQCQWRDTLQALGYAWHLCRSWTDAARETLRYLGIEPKEYGL